MKRAWILLLALALMTAFASASSACPVGVAGVATPNSTVCAESSSGTLYCDTADANGDFWIIGGAVPPSTGGCLPTSGTFWFYEVDCYDDGMSLNRNIPADQYGGPWLDVTCQPKPTHEPKICLLATDWEPGVDTNLWDVNMTTGAVYNSRPTGLGSVIGLAIHPDNTHLYTVTTFGTNPSTNSLYEVDMVTGASTLIGPLGIGNISEGDLAFGDDGTLYGIMASKLYTIDTSTGAATLIGNPYGSDYSYLSFDAAGTLFGIDNSSTPGQVATTLDELNETNANVISSQTVTTMGGYGGMDWYQLGGWMWVADGRNPGSVYAGNRQLFRLNPNTGTFTTVGNLGLSHGVSGLAACKPCAVETALDPSVGEEPSELSHREVLSMAYRVRDELLETTRVGVHYKDTFYKHSLRMVYLMAVDESLRSGATNFLHQMAPGFFDLLDRDGRNYSVSADMVEAAQDLAERFSSADRDRGGEKLANAVAEELERVDLGSLIGRSFSEAWAYLNTLSTGEEGGGGEGGKR